MVVATMMVVTYFEDENFECIATVGDSFLETFESNCLKWVF